MVGSGNAINVAHVFNVVGFAGSLRRGSYNRALLRPARELAPPTLHIDIHELDDIPLYNSDVEAGGIPPSVIQLREAIGKADALLRPKIRCVSISFLGRRDYRPHFMKPLVPI